MSTKERKHPAPPRYDEAFKAGAVRMVTEQGRPSREVAAELGICIDTLRSWLKAAGAPSPGQADRQNRDARRLRELEAEIRALRKKLEEKDGVIDILKNPSAYFPNHRGQVPVHPYGPRGASVELVCRLLEVSPQRVLRMAGPQTLFAPAEGSGTETPAAEPAPALSRPWAGQPVSPDPPAAFLLAQAHPPPDERDEHLLHAQACLQSHDQLKTRAPHRAQSPCAPLLL